MNAQLLITEDVSLKDYQNITTVVQHHDQDIFDEDERSATLK